MSMSVDVKISEAWLEAGQHLRIRVTTPFEVTLDSGEVVVAEAYLPDFGGHGGAVLVALLDEERADQVGTSKYYCSQLAPDYQQYDEELFQLTLDDWGWYGDAAPPSWYNGREQA
jgi:hypothetical protein